MKRKCCEYLPQMGSEFSHMAECTKKRTGELMRHSLDKAHGFGILDYTIFKTALFSFGILLGARFANFFRKHRFLVTLSFLCSYVYLIWRVFFRDENKL